MLGNGVRQVIVNRLGQRPQRLDQPVISVRGVLKRFGEIFLGPGLLALEQRAEDQTHPEADAQADQERGSRIPGHKTFGLVVTVQSPFASGVVSAWVNADHA